MDTNKRQQLTSRKGRNDMFYLLMLSIHFILQLYGVGHNIKDHSDSETENPLQSWATLSSKGFLYALFHRQDNTHHGLCYTSSWALVWMSNRSMGPPWIDPTTHSTICECSTMELHLTPSLIEINNRLRSIPNRQGSIPDWQGSIPNWQGSIPNWQGSISDSQGSIPDWQGSIPDWRGSIPNWQGSISDWQGSIPDWQGSILGWQGSIPNWQGSIPNWQGSISDSQDQS